jgi:hypothetical protein
MRRDGKSERGSDDRIDIRGKFGAAGGYIKHLTFIAADVVVESYPGAMVALFPNVAFAFRREHRNPVALLRKCFPNLDGQARCQSLVASYTTITGPTEVLCTTAVAKVPLFAFFRVVSSSWNFVFLTALFFTK